VSPGVQKSPYHCGRHPVPGQRVRDQTTLELNGPAAQSVQGLYGVVKTRQRPAAGAGTGNRFTAARIGPPALEQLLACSRSHLFFRPELSSGTIHV
jgi:hypothetical protein